MVRTRTPRRRTTTESSVLCEGHQELRDIVIETRNDVKHIRGALDKGDETMKEHGKRIDALESERDQRKGFERSIKAIATTRATVVSVVISLAGLIIAAIAYLWPQKGSP